MFPAFSWWEAGLLAAILAPTDAGLGQIIVNSPRVPERVREALNVEAGLNDGLSVPFLLFFMAMAGAGGGDASFMRFIGWFGPRGLASIVLGLVYLAESDKLPGKNATRLAVMATVLLSIFAHGLSAQPGIRALARVD